MKILNLLTEAYILLESKVDFILSNKSIVDKLQNRIKEDHSIDNNTTPEELLKQFDTYKNISVYLPWVIKQYINKYFLYEDLSRVDNELAEFNRIKSKLENKDLNKYTYTELDDILDKYKDTEVKSQRQEKKDIKSNEAEVFYESPKWEVIIPKTHKASCIYGANTKWCTASRNDNSYFNRYTEDGPLYIIINKKTGEKWQFHFETNSFMDARDYSIDKYNFFKKNKELLDIFKDKFKRTNPISWLIEPPSKEEQLAAVKNDPQTIKYIANPTEEEQLIAVKEDGNVIKYIKNPTEAVQLAAVKQYGFAIQYIKNPTEEIKLAAVKKNGGAVKYINNPTEEIQLAAVKDYGLVIEYIKNPSESVQLAAVKADDYNIKFIENPSEAIQLVAVKQYGFAIKYIANPSEEVQLAAINSNPEAIRFMRNPSEKAQLAAVKQLKYLIKYIKNPTEKVKKIAGIE